MSNRIYILIALAILIASPIIVNVVSTALPPPSATHASEEVGLQDVADEPREQAQDESPPPPEVEAGSTEPAFDVQPSMDTAGIAPAPLADEPGSDSSPPPRDSL